MAKLWKLFPYCHISIPYEKNSFFHLEDWCVISANTSRFWLSFTIYNRSHLHLSTERTHCKNFHCAEFYADSCPTSANMNAPIAQPETDNDAGISIIKSGPTLFFCNRTMKTLIRHPSDTRCWISGLWLSAAAWPATRAVNDTARTTLYDVAQRTVQCDSSHSYSRFVETEGVIQQKCSWRTH